MLSTLKYANARLYALINKKQLAALVGTILLINNNNTFYNINNNFNFKCQFFNFFFT